MQGLNLIQFELDRAMIDIIFTFIYQSFHINTSKRTLYTKQFEKDHVPLLKKHVGVVSLLSDQGDCPVSTDRTLKMPIQMYVCRKCPTKHLYSFYSISKQYMSSQIFSSNLLDYSSVTQKQIFTNLLQIESRPMERRMPSGLEWLQSSVGIRSKSCYMTQHQLGVSVMKILVEDGRGGLHSSK